MYGGSGSGLKGQNELSRIGSHSDVIMIGHKFDKNLTYPGFYIRLPLTCSARTWELGFRA